jgi:uncharacterized protein YneF (UPF0154 family)
MRQVSRRVLVFWIVSILVALLAGAWVHGLLSNRTTEERAREEAERIKERVRQMTH